jgi:hypothetical protein
MGECGVMDEKVRSQTSGYKEFPDYDTLEWHWWHNVLGLAIILAIVIVIAW